MPFLVKKEHEKSNITTATSLLMYVPIRQHVVSLIHVHKRRIAVVSGRIPPFFFKGSQFCSVISPLMSSYDCVVF